MRFLALEFEIWMWANGNRQKLILTRNNPRMSFNEAALEEAIIDFMEIRG
jgi:hypothetical protein